MGGVGVMRGVRGVIKVRKGRSYDGVGVMWGVSGEGGDNGGSCKKLYAVNGVKGEGMLSCMLVKVSRVEGWKGK